MAVKQKEKKPLHLAKMNIKKGDTVLIITGKDRGKQGTVSRALPQVSKVVVEGLNVAPWAPIKRCAWCAYAKNVRRSSRTGRGVVKHYGIKAERKISTRGRISAAKR